MNNCIANTPLSIARFVIAIALPFAHAFCAAQGITDENALFEGLCTAFENHPLRGARITGCMVTHNEVSQSVPLRGTDLTGSDLEDLCASIGGTPAADGNLGMTVSDASGPSFSRPCQIALPARRPIRRIPVD